MVDPDRIILEPEDTIGLAHFQGIMDAVGLCALVALAYLGAVHWHLW